MKFKNIFRGKAEPPEEDDVEDLLLISNQYNFFKAENGIVNIFGEINDNSALKVIDDIFSISITMPNEPICLMINSPGGDVFQSLAIIDAIRSIPNRVIGIVHGMAGSGAFYILQACDDRLMFPTGHLFWHEIISFDMNPISTETESRRRHEDYVKLNSVLIDGMKKRACISEEVWNTQFKNRNDIIFSSKEAKKLNLVDAVLKSTKQIVKRLDGEKYVYNSTKSQQTRSRREDQSSSEGS